VPGEQANISTEGANGKLPLVAHIIHRFAMGGLENGSVNLISHMPPDRYRHDYILD
jgi:hypothetical protein